MKTDKGGSSFVSWLAVPYERWTHVAAAYDPAGKPALLVLINGSPAHYWRRYKGLSDASGRPLGADRPCEIASGFRGRIDELRISTRPRTKGELHGRWLSGRMGDIVPFRPDAVAPPLPAGWHMPAAWLSAAQAVPTFDSMSLYVRYRGDVNADSTCHVRFRPEGAAAWRQGIDLEPCRMDGEFRGSLLMLDSDTAYEIELSADDPDGRAADNVYPADPEDLVAPLRFVKRTWAEEVKIAQVRRLPTGVRHEPLLISERGRPDGWVLYAPPDGETSVIDVGHSVDHAVRIDRAAYVVFERALVRGALRGGVLVTNSHHVRIRRCEITDFGEAGRPGPDGRAVDEHGKLINHRNGVQLGLMCRQIVVEDNLIHAPRGTSLSWTYGHPTGPDGMVLGPGAAWNNVIRNNDIIGSEEHWWMDGINSAQNSITTGGPYRDTDVCGNVIAFVNDDAHEFDGGQINVRSWHNRAENVLNGISVCPNIKGPSYVFRNLFVNLGDRANRCGRAFKMAALHLDYGRSFLMNNTRVAEHGACWANGEHTRAPYTHGQIFTATLRNNLHLVDRAFDFQYPASKERHALVAPESGDYHLAPNSTAIDAGVPIPNVTDRFVGKAPDLGAFEHGLDDRYVIPRRASGMRVRPERVLVTGDRASEPVAVSVTIPLSAGTTWTARPNSPWLRCTPTSGSTADGPQKVQIEVVGEGREPRRYRGAVVFRTDQGLNCTLMADAIVQPATPFTKHIEAEQSRVTGGMKTVADPAASGGAFVHWPPMNEGEPPPGRVEFRFAVPSDDIYYIAGRCLCPEARHNSFYFSMDGTEASVWIVYANTEAYTWDLVNQKQEKERGLKRIDPMPFRLSKGEHTFAIKSRRTGIRLDRIAISNSPQTPE